MLKYLRAIAIGLVPPLAVVALPTEAPELTCLAMIYLYLGGLVLAVAFFISFFITRSKADAPNALILVVMIWLLVWNYGFTVGARIHLLVNERRYIATIAELGRAKSNEDKVRICGEGCDPGYQRSIVISTIVIASSTGPTSSTLPTANSTPPATNFKRSTSISTDLSGYPNFGISDTSVTNNRM